MGLLHHPFWLQLIYAFWALHFNFFNFFVWLRITDEGSLPGMRIWSILLIESELKWCINLKRGLCIFLVINVRRAIWNQHHFVNGFSDRLYSSAVGKHAHNDRNRHDCWAVSFTPLYIHCNCTEVFNCI